MQVIYISDDFTCRCLSNRVMSEMNMKGKKTSSLSVAQTCSK